ncbi:MAG TPA: TlpA disulfide reductase family protein [Thermoanaerobaculia bacterium]
MRRTLLLLVTALCLPYANAQDSPLVAAARAGKQRLGATRQPAPELHTVRWFNSDRDSLQAFHGDVVLVDFWATWCGPCVGAHTKIQKLARDFGPQGFSAVLVHARYTRSGSSHRADVPAEEVLPAFIAEHHLVVPVAIADKDEFRQLGVHGIPHYLLIDRQGFIRYDRVGRLPEDSEIRKLLAE